MRGKAPTHAPGPKYPRGPRAREGWPIIIKDAGEKLMNNTQKQKGEMKTMTISKTITELQTIKAEASQRLEEYTEKVYTSRAAKAKATEEAAAAHAAMDPAAYHAAMENSRIAEDAARMYQDAVDRLSREPLISEEDYRAKSEEIRAELDKVTDTAAYQIADHIGKAIEIAKSAYAAIAEGNRALHILQHDIFRDDACMQLQNGNRMHIDMLENCYKGAEAFSVTVEQLGYNVFYKERNHHPGR